MPRTTLAHSVTAKILEATKRMMFDLVLRLSSLSCTSRASRPALRRAAILFRKRKKSRGYPRAQREPHQTHAAPSYINVTTTRGRPADGTVPDPLLVLEMETAKSSRPPPMISTRCARTGVTKPIIERR